MTSSDDETSRSDLLPNVVFIVGDNVGWGTSAVTADRRPDQEFTGYS